MRCRKTSNSTIKSYFETDITHEGPIYALSDVHTDIHAFIIALRDCAKVITKNRSIELDKVDPDLDDYLNINISRGITSEYDESLGYKWIGGNSYVVICGDMIDPNKNGDYGPTCTKTCNERGGICNCTYYPQSEIKLLMFINKINETAIKHGGKIIKLLGNHEVANIRNIDLGGIFQQELDKEEKYYMNQSRKEIFLPGNIGYDLLFQDGCGILIKINNTIFVHAKLPEDYTLLEINEFNQIINNLDFIRGNPENEYIERIYKNLDDNYSELIDRKWGRPEDPKIGYISYEKFERNVHNVFRHFLKEHDIIKYRVVIGHCIQSDYSIEPEEKTTFINKIHEDQYRKIYDAKSPKKGLIDPNDQDFIFGITMDIPKKKFDELTDYYIYRVDVGSSREIDADINTLIKQYDGINSIGVENKFLFSRTPQILAIIKENGQDKITIIKSKMKNTRIHLPRLNYEAIIQEFIKKYPRDFDIKMLDLSNSHYLKIKYLKYKKKYLELKNTIN